MPKLPNITNAELKSIVTYSETALDDMHAIIDRMEKGYVDRMEQPLETARHFAQLATAAARTASLVLYMADHQRQKDELEALKQKTRAG